MEIELLNEPTISVRKWHAGKKWFFLFGMTYSVLYIFPFPFNFIDYLSEYVQLFTTHTWDKIVPWAGTQLLDIEEEILIRQTGSGDMTYNYVQHYLLFLISMILATLWWLIDWNRSNYDTLLRWTMRYIRYFLLMSLFIYGAVKVIKLQFPDVGLSRLIQPYGDSSPMGLAWTFMGHSKLYCFFAGASEALAALLLLWRRTRTLGAIVAFGVCLNIFIMNMSFDIPVKLYSFHLLFFSFLILLTDARRLINVLLLNRPTAAYNFHPIFKNKFLNISGIVLKLVLIGFFVFVTVEKNLERRSTYGSEAPKPELYGIYDVEQYVINGDTLAPLTTDEQRWGRLLIDTYDRGTVIGMDAQQKSYYKYGKDSLTNELTLTRFQDSIPSYRFAYEKEGKFLHLTGTYRADSLEIQLKEYDLDNFKLTNRGFHWVNEYPFNR